MLIFGSNYIKNSTLRAINSIEDIDKTTPNDILLLKEFKKPFDLAKYCQKNNLIYAIEAKNLLDSIYASALDAGFVIADFELAKQIQTLANEYLWDMKVLAKIKNEKELEIVAKAFIDGAIFYNFD